LLVFHHHNPSGAGGHGETLEPPAAKVVGASLLLAGAYVIAQAARALLAGARTGPSRSTVAVAVAVASLLVLPPLAIPKRRLAAPTRLNSYALHGDSVLSAVGAALAGATLLGLLLTALVGWRWADRAAAITIAGVLLREGGDVLRAPSRQTRPS
jgi:divalent metal cation (Fe/Co/Zn/Cd) transporter